MFNNIGTKIKVAAKALAIVGIIASILIGIFTFTANIGLAVTIAIFVSLISYICSLAVYGLGELIESTAENNALLKQIVSTNSVDEKPAGEDTTKSEEESKLSISNDNKKESGIVFDPETNEYTFREKSQ